MEECKATPVHGIEAAAQIVPTFDFMHSFVGDDFFKNGGGRLPVDAAQDEKTAIEPRLQKMLQVAIDGGQIQFGLRRAQEFVAKRDDLGRSAGRKIETAEKLAPRALGCFLQT